MILYYTDFEWDGEADEGVLAPQPKCPTLSLAGEEDPGEDRFGRQQHTSGSGVLNAVVIPLAVNCLNLPCRGVPRTCSFSLMTNKLHCGGSVWILLKDCYSGHLLALKTCVSKLVLQLHLGPQNVVRINITIYVPYILVD